MYCKNCGARIAGNDKFCRNCGAPAKYALGRVESEKEKAFWRHAWFTILMLFMCFPVGVILVFINHPSVAKTFFVFLFGLIMLAFVAVGFDGCSSNVSEPVPYKIEQHNVSNGRENKANSENNMVVSKEQQRTTATSKIIKNPVGLPDQIYFGYKLYDFKVAYEKTDNKLQKSAIKNRQAKFLKGYFPNNELKNWRGEIKEIGSVEKGKFASVEIECRVGDMLFTVGTEKFNIKLSGKQTLIENNSKLYKEIFNLEKGDAVEFSAMVIPNKESGLYLDNWASESFSIKSPEFIVLFKDIKKITDY